MVAFVLSLAGGATALYCLWQLRRWLAEAEAAAGAGPRRMEALIDELLATAEATTAMVDEKAETLAVAVAEADRRLAALAAVSARAQEVTPQAVVMQPQPVMLQPQPAVTVPQPAPVPVQPDPATARVAAAVEAVRQGKVPLPSADEGDLYAQVQTLAGAGVSVTAIARKLGLSKGEVQLILGLGKVESGVKP